MHFDAGSAAYWMHAMRRVAPSIKGLENAVGGLSKPSKMPWYSYSLPAARCNVGGKLRKRKGSVCSSCYAHKGRYVFPKVQEALERRYQRLVLSPNAWAGTMVELLRRKAKGQPQHFRWHDSGDLQGDWHLDAIIWIARQLPGIQFWLPTKEYGLVNANVDKIRKVPNLTVRVSAPLVGTALTPGPLPTSSVAAGTGHQCPAYDNGGKCGECRACWSPELNVDYPLH